MSADPVATIREHVQVMAFNLGQWDGRDDTKAQPEVRQAGSAAVAAIDALLRDLHTIRRRLIGEIHASDTASAARSCALLDRLATD